MGRLDRYSVFDRTVKADLTPYKLHKEEKGKNIMEVELIDTRVDISRPNSLPGLTDFLIHRIADYQREDTQVRLLPHTHIHLDHLLEPVPVLKELA